MHNIRGHLTVVTRESGAIGAAAQAIIAHLHYSAGCIIAIVGGRPLA